MRTASSVRRLTIAEAADKFKVHPQRLYRAIRSGQLAAVKWGWSYSILEDDVRHWLDKKSA